MSPSGLKKTILFLCTGNSCRSQMAEGFTTALKGDELLAFSAGVNPGRVDPRAVTVMAEAGIDLSDQKSKSVEDLPEAEFDYVVTVCDNARENCPFFPAKTRLVHVGFDDPPHLTSGMKEEEALIVYRRVRDEIKAFVGRLPQSLEE